MALIQNIRNNLTGTAAKIIVGIIAVTFALFFGGNYVLFDNDANVIASVNSKKIDVFDLDLEMSRVQTVLRQRFDDPDFSVEEETLRSLALNSLISDALVLDFLKKNKVEVQELSAYKLLAQNEIFQEEGKFSLGKVNTFARQNGFLPGKYIQSISEDIALNFWRVGLGASSFLTSTELNQNIKLANQTRDITFTKINKKDIEVVSAHGQLTVRSKKEETDHTDNTDLKIYQGISKRQFVRSFTVADTIEVRGAELKDGLLVIALERIIPEEHKEKFIEIK